MKIITSADNKRKLAEEFGCSIETVRASLDFRHRSSKALNIRNHAMNELRSFYV